MGTVSAQTQVDILFGGDTSHGENYQEKYAAEGAPHLLNEKGYDFAFERLKPLMEGADYIVLNLETPLTTRQTSPVAEKSPCHWSDPAQATQSLVRLGVDAVSLANNHALDYGSEGLHETLRALDAAGIASFGAGVDQASAEQPLLLAFPQESPELVVAIIGAFERRDWYAPYDFYAHQDHRGVNPIDAGRLRDQIAAIKALDPEPFVIVTPHWGENYVWRSNDLRDFAEEIAAAGADMIIGHGAHCLQEIELINGCWVFYSIGNFVFNTNGRFQKLNSHHYSLPLRLTLNRGESDLKVSVRGYPIVSDNLVTGYSPRVITAQEVGEVKQLLLAKDAYGSLAHHAAWKVDSIGPHIFIADATPLDATDSDPIKE